ncbi:DUF3467 domain-containing protein [Phototrophicus methaneseepsis]|uniref:DUF3467 domain-containing protein n=1 Tax=Phototrophicus methaneseepsis TaxID=2710758 RepID=A0A7S8IE88_9CHLR|nr:DUF3467 domain-containing protein [Phototrophicus methaneseepsis]QPC82317.1 DUF3467 domain-containing protein [Phototrophicus methaneseepsis]
MQPKNPNPKRRQLRIEMPKDPASYANAVMISNSATHTEVIFDFMQVMPNDPRARIQNRIVMTPMHAKMFLNALRQNIERFEANHGEIEVPQSSASLADQLFRGVVGPESDDSDDEDNGDADG